jgi:hypothetical protein
MNTTLTLLQPLTVALILLVESNRSLHRTNLEETLLWLIPVKLLMARWANKKHLEDSTKEMVLGLLKKQLMSVKRRSSITTMARRSNSTRITKTVQQRETSLTMKTRESQDGSRLLSLLILTGLKLLEEDLLRHKERDPQRMRKLRLTRVMVR